MKIGVVPKKPAIGVTTSAIFGNTRLLNPTDKPNTVPNVTAIMILRVVRIKWRIYPKQRSGRSNIPPPVNSNSSNRSGQA